MQTEPKEPILRLACEVDELKKQVNKNFALKSDSSALFKEQLDILGEEIASDINSLEQAIKLMQGKQ